MKFHFAFDIKKLPWPVSHYHKLMLVGSCFTENIGEKLKRYKFSVLENPNGILFNPVSVAESIGQYIENKVFSKNDVFQYQEAWHSWKHHSRFSSIEEGDALRRINAATESAHHYLKNADYLLITLGSSWIYTLTDKAVGGTPGAVAANNHKAPADWFERRLMKIEEVLHVLDNMIHRLFHFNPGIRIIFTVSPVRHLREGVVENNRSKAILLHCVHHLIDKFEGLYYFPAYELVIDDLRDYRFYAEDLVHPNYAATQYVWEKFVNACLSDPSQQLIETLHGIYLAYKHKPFNPASTAHHQFLSSYLSKTKALAETYPYLDLAAELAYFTYQGRAGDQ